VSELDALKTPYTNNITALRKARDERAAPYAKNYLAALDRLEKQMPAIAAAVKAERDRLSAGQELTTAGRSAMPAPLVDLYTRFAADVQRSDAAFTQQEQQLTRQYLSSLDTLQRKFLALNEVSKAAQVRAERDAVAAAVGAPAATGKDEKTPAASTIRNTSPRAATNLDPALADKIAAAVNSKSYTRGPNSVQEGGATKGRADIPEDGALLVGFEVFQFKDGGIRSLRPYFLTRQGLVPGEDRGKMEKVTDKVLARPGFAVAGLVTDGKSGIQVIFMKMDAATGRFATDASSTYKSQWLGKKGHGKPLTLGGDGSLIIGVYGKTGSDCDDIGLITMK
jgi:hypothetical protein